MPPRMIFIFLTAFSILFQTLYTASLQIKIVQKSQINQLMQPYQTVSNSFPLINAYDNFYLGVIQLGTHQQDMTVAFDTGSSIFWVYSLDCLFTQQKMCGQPYQIYNYHKSTKYMQANVNHFTLQYQDGLKIESAMRSDLFSIKDTPISVLHSVNMASQAFDDIGGRYDGILGLSYTPDQPNFLDYAYMMGQIKSNVFAFSLGKSNNDLYDQNNFFLFDELPQELINNSTYITGTDQYLWQIPFTNITTDFDSQSISIPSGFASIDTGSSYLILENSVFDELYNQVWSKDCMRLGSYIQCSCTPQTISNYATIILHSNDVQFPLESSYYFLYTYNICLLRVSNGTSTIFGDVFLRKYIVSFDKRKNRMGFATHAPSKTDVSSAISLMIETEIIFISLTSISVVVGFYIGIKSKVMLKSAKISLLNNDALSTTNQADIIHNNNIKIEEKNINVNETSLNSSCY